MDNRSIPLRCMGNHVHIPIEAAFYPNPPSLYSIIFFPSRRQFYITPFPTKDWMDLWRIKLVLEDEPGLFNAIVDTLQGLGLNILSETSGVSRELYHAEFIVSGEDYESRFDRDTNDRRRNPNSALRYVEAVLTINFLDRLRFIRIQRGLRGTEYEPDLKIERMREHYDLYRDHHKEVSDYSDYSTSYFPIQRGEGKDATYDYWIKFPDEWYSELIDITGHTASSDAQPELTYIVSASGRNRLMTLTFLKVNQVWYRIRIGHKDRVGALHAFSKALPGLNLNLTATLTERIEKKDGVSGDERWNCWEFMYESVGPSDVTPLALVKELNKALTNAEVKKYKPKIEVWYGGDWKDNWKEVDRDGNPIE